MGKRLTKPLPFRGVAVAIVALILFGADRFVVGAQEIETPEQSTHLSMSLFRVTFPTNVSTLDSQQEGLVATVINDLSMWDTSGFHILLEGRADARGSSSYNQTLSQSRIDHVRKNLIERGYKGSITERAFGEQQPIDLSNPTGPKNRSVTANLVCTDANIDACLCFQRRARREISSQSDINRDSIDILLRIREVSLKAGSQCPSRLFVESRHFNYSTWDEIISSGSIVFPVKPEWADQIIWSGRINEGDELLVLGYDSPLFCAAEQVPENSFTFNMKIMKFDGELASVIQPGSGMSFIPNPENNFRYNARFGSCEFEFKLEVNAIGLEHKERLIVQ